MTVAMAIVQLSPKQGAEIISRLVALETSDGIQLAAQCVFELELEPRSQAQD